MHGYFMIFLVLLVLAWVGGAIWFFSGPAKAADSYVNQLAGSITRRDDAVLFRRRTQTAAGPGLCARIFHGRRTSPAAQRTTTIFLDSRLELHPGCEQIPE